MDNFNIFTDDIPTVKHYNPKWRMARKNLKYSAPWNREHKELLKLRKQQRDLIRGKQRINCPCGSTINKSFLSQHKKSSFHLNRMKILDDFPDSPNPIKQPQNPTL